MIADLSRNWWVLALGGVLGILFGIVAFVWPGATLAALILVFGAYVFVDGIFAVIAGVGMRRQMDRWWLLVLEGAAGIILGVLTFRSPDTTALVLLTFIAAWSIVTGIFEIATDDIAIAQKLLAGAVAPRIPNGRVVRGDPDVNVGYSWHIDPTLVEFADPTTEVCDGRPSDVEKGTITSEWYCPWSAHVVAIAPASSR
jgi:Short repeat of unknown function (DUF308)